MPRDEGVSRGVAVVIGTASLVVGMILGAQLLLATQKCRRRNGVDDFGHYNSIPESEGSAMS